MSAGVPLCLCPVCGESLDAVTSLNGGAARPRPGDFSLCFGCGTVLRFGAGLTVSLPTEAEMEAADPDTLRDLRFTAAVLKAFRRSRPAKDHDQPDRRGRH